MTNRPKMMSLAQAVDWVAGNDEPLDLEFESVESFISVMLVADIYQLKASQVATMVINRRKAIAAGVEV